MGFACSANIGDEVAVFEPTHGSAPKYEKLDPPIINPIAMILSACMMLDHLGETAKSDKIKKAIAAVVAEGKVRTYDMMRLPGGAGCLQQRRREHEADGGCDYREAVRKSDQLLAISQGVIAMLRLRMVLLGMVGAEHSGAYYAKAKSTSL